MNSSGCAPVGRRDQDLLVLGSDYVVERVERDPPMGVFVVEPSGVVE